ncbi:site-specific integrase [Bosea sp. BH3]|uniref:site-specific integrase n=1 Tax=Bosea sp. BH3 TaxID=2871701 RepID=UPI0021CB0E31|nr:site-specific integrase [Bosea sp. BH3]MCU4180113.1 site-specific integrase [Bosea sp. BH3]
MTKGESAAPANFPTLPASVETRDGVTFDPRPDDWETYGPIYGYETIKISEFSRLTSDLKLRIKLILIHYITSYSYAHFFNIFCRFVAFYRDQIAIRDGYCSEITMADLINYRSSLNPKTEWKLGVVRILLLDMNDLGYGGCSEEAVRFLRDSTIAGNIKGTSIRLRDADAGAFNDSELRSIQVALNRAYVAGDISLPTYVMAWVFLAYGARPIQIAALKVKDLIVNLASDGSRLYMFRIPRAKQRGRRIRDKIKDRYCSKQLGQLIELLIEFNIKNYGHLSLEDGEMPLFFGDDRGRIPGMEFHMSSQELGHHLKKSIFEITGLKANAKRFRITLAQRAVDDGKDKYTVADLLDQSDTQNVGPYFEASPAMVERLDRHLAMELAPLAQAFAGVLISAAAGNPRLRIYDKTLKNNIDPLGSCGQMSFCGLYAPYACYTCQHFQAWIHAPHEELLSFLIEDRDRMIAEGYSRKVYDNKYPTILAVAQVIQLCDGAREGHAGVDK